MKFLFRRERPRQKTDVEALRARAAEAAAEECGARDRFFAQLQTWSSDRQSAPRRVLLVEDDDSYRALLADLLRHHLACSVCEAATVDAALGSARVEDFDIVVTDLRLPGEHGAEFIRRIRHQSMRPLVPIVMISSYADDEIGDVPVLAGANVFVSKSRGVAAVLAAVSRLLDLSPADPIPSHL